MCLKCQLKSAESLNWGNQRQLIQTVNRPKIGGKTLVCLHADLHVCMCVWTLSSPSYTHYSPFSLSHFRLMALYSRAGLCRRGDSAFDSLYAEHMWDRTWSSPAEKTWPPEVTLMFITSHQSPQLFPFNHNLNFPFVSRNICISL